ncbi:unnamed protein product [Meganyctiphanes norvegica]|uniref:C2H2-type domain-containing protein n=1 Tax=Meganyctiphanes norvegica TaxID=48144 RepID=A0AAV2SC97_MEGNR
MSNIRNTSEQGGGMNQEGNGFDIFKPFQCTVCDLRFTTNAAKNIHVKTHKTSEILVCTICNFKTRDFATLRNHRLNNCEHKTFKCKKCRMRFATTTKLKDHMQKEHKIRIFSCKQCDFKTSSKVSLTRHTNQTHPSHPSEDDGIDFACADCDYTCGSKDLIKKHIKDMHTADGDIASPLDDSHNDVFTCPLCDYLDADAYSMEMHIKEFHEVNKPWACTECDFECYDDEQLELHMESEHEVDKSVQGGYTVAISTKEHDTQVHTYTDSDYLSCTLCDFTSTSSEELETHIFDIHTKDDSENITKISKSGRKIQPKKFFDEYEVILRNNIQAEWRKNIDESKDELFIRQGINCKCTICGQYFVNKKGLNTHMRKKHEELKCEDCNTEFKTLAGLKNHMNKVHSSTEIYSCPKCEYKCGTEMDLRRHLSVHEPKKQFSCLECEVSYDDNDDLMSHILSMNHTGDKPFSCTKCKAQFLTTAGLNIHMDSHDANNQFNVQIENPVEEKQIYDDDDEDDYIHMDSHDANNQFNVQIENPVEEKHTYDDDYDDEDDSFPHDDNYVFSCPLCDYLDTNSTSIEIHIQEFHNVNEAEHSEQSIDENKYGGNEILDESGNKNISEYINDSTSLDDPECVDDPLNHDDWDIVDDSQFIDDRGIIDDLESRKDPEKEVDNDNESHTQIEISKNADVSEDNLGKKCELNNIAEVDKVKNEDKCCEEITGKEDSACQNVENSIEGDDDDDDDDFGVEGDYIGDDIYEDEGSPHENIQNETTLYQENIHQGKELKDKNQEIVNPNDSQEFESFKNNSNVKDVESLKHSVWIVEGNDTVPNVTSINLGTNVNKVEDLNLKEESQIRQSPISRKDFNEHDTDSPGKRKADESFVGPATKKTTNNIQDEEVINMLDGSIDGTEEVLDLGNGTEILYGCDECDFVGTKKSLHIHAKKHYSNFFCDQCDFSCCTQKSLHIHKTKYHSEGNFFTCAKCNYTSKTAQGIKHHIKTHNKTEYLCDRCAFKCVDVEVLKKHYTHNHNAPLRFIISQEQENKKSRKFRKKCANAKHYSSKPIEVKGSKERRRRKIIAIPYMTGLPTPSNNSENSASSTKPNDEIDGSDDAGSSGESENTEPFESSGKTGDPRYQCKYCHFMSISRRGLSVHMKGVHGITNAPPKYPRGTWIGTKKYACELCEYIAPSSQLIAVHFRTHLGEKPWTCMECGARFTHKTSMKIHEACHLEEKPFICKYEGCNYATRVKINLDTHYYKHRFEEKKNRNKTL